MRELSFTVSIVNDNITEDTETFNVSLTLDPADQDRLGNRTCVTVLPEVATVTIQDDEGKHVVTSQQCSINSNFMINCQDHDTHMLIWFHTLLCV